MTPEVMMIAAGAAGLMTGAAFGVYYGQMLGERAGFEAAKWAHSFRLFNPNEALIGASQQAAVLKGPYNVPPGSSKVSIGVQGGGGAGGSSNMGGGGGSASGIAVSNTRQGSAVQNVGPITPIQQRALNHLAKDELKAGMMDLAVQRDFMRDELIKLKADQDFFAKALASQLPIPKTPSKTGWV